MNCFVPSNVWNFPDGMIAAVIGGEVVFSKINVQISKAKLIKI
jgi:hypothetical protein